MLREDAESPERLPPACRQGLEASTWVTPTQINWSPALPEPPEPRPQGQSLQGASGNDD